MTRREEMAVLTRELIRQYQVLQTPRLSRRTYRLEFKLYAKLQKRFRHLSLFRRPVNKEAS